MEVNPIIAFLFGILSFLSPCLLPIVPIIAAYSTKSGRLRPITTVIGLSMSFTLLGVLVSGFGSVFQQYQTVLYLIGGGVIVFFGIYMIFEEIEMKIRELTSKIWIMPTETSVGREGIFGGLLLGISLGIVWNKEDFRSYSYYFWHLYGFVFLKVIGMKERILEWIDSCDGCKTCAEVCPTYEVTGREIFSPFMRLKTAKTIIEGGDVSDEMVESMYNCPECGRCEEICPNGIKVADVVAFSRRELVNRGFAPLEGHERIIRGIVEKGNSVGGDPEKRLEWLPEEFEEKKSDTLLYLGCLASYLVKESALSSYLLLKRAGVDFMILEDEGCCGIYPYDAGVYDLAREIFSKNASRFEKLGIKRIITPCAGCYRCFKRYYPEVLGEMGFEVYHIVEVIHDLIKRGKLSPEKKNLKATYHDPCRLGRKEGLYDQPREILRESGIEILEIKENREKGMCCGSGSGIRSIYRDLSMEIAKNLLESSERILITSCPFCVFNLKYTSRKKGKEVEVRYIGEMV
ncbi:MAG: heterodisulfide reductase-related iron-sulfur binding cluster [Candidatus Syntropharchaeia archaeon]